MPDLVLEAEAGGIVAGIDEAGRGPWAGPVVAAAVVIDVDRIPDALRGTIDDSKALRPEERRRLIGEITGCARVGIGAASAREIDIDNVLQATMRAMQRAVRSLGVVPDLALIDGNRAPDLPCPCCTVIKGDSLSLSIAAASIVAKVTRDRAMAALAARYPGFGWERNAGYGTAEHMAALERFGVTPHHRKSYRPVHNILSRA